MTILLISHDCEGAVGYVVETKNEKVVYVTDTGCIKDKAKGYIRNTGYYVFESNHSVEMLVQTTRSVYLKQRIVDDHGHPCNEDCSNILCDVMRGRTEEIVFVYISQERNTWDMTLTTLKETLKRRQKGREGLRLYPAD